MSKNPEKKPMEEKTKKNESLSDEQLEQASGGTSPLETPGMPDDGQAENDETRVVAHMRPSHLA